MRLSTLRWPARRPTRSCFRLAAGASTPYCERRSTAVSHDRHVLDRIAGRIVFVATRCTPARAAGAINAFAGEDYETAVFSPEDDRYLVERDLTSAHYEVARSAP
jgi:hypothetical protein